MEPLRTNPDRAHLSKEKEDRNVCPFKDCTRKLNWAAIKCNECGFKFCSVHRYPEAVGGHNCPKLSEFKARKHNEFAERFNQAFKKGLGEHASARPPNAAC